MGKGQELYKKAKTLIPGGTSLLSKRPEQLLPENWPAYYSKSKGCRVWDLDGREYIDCGLMGANRLSGQGRQNGPGPDFECKRSVVCRLRMPAGFVLLVFL